MHARREPGKSLYQDSDPELEVSASALWVLQCFSPLETVILTERFLKRKLSPKELSDKQHNEFAEEGVFGENSLYEIKSERGSEG